MKTAGVVMDSYKAQTFRANLKEGGFEWTEHPGPFKKILTFIVSFCPKDFERLSRIIKASNDVSRNCN